MRSWIRGLLETPQRGDYLGAQRARLLNTMLLWTFLVACISAVLNVGMGDVRGAGILAVLALLCVAGVYLSHSGQPDAAGFLLCLGIFVAITAEAFFGAGIHDAAVGAYPVLILCSAFLFGNRWGLRVGTAASIGAVVGLWQGELAGVVQTPFPATPFRVLTLAALFVATAAVTQVIRATWDDNLRRLLESYDETLRGWALALEYRDGETAGHCQRVVGLSVRLARELGCSDDEIETIKRGAYLHDIGKMAIPDEILKKPGPLSPEERDVIQRHPDLGLGMIQGIPFLDDAAKIMYAHHESWDGTGYPHQLKAEEIPFGARIFSIVDQWDALSSDRAYRPAWPSEKVKRYIAEQSGKAFDPRVTEVFLRMVD